MEQMSILGDWRRRMSAIGVVGDISQYLKGERVTRKLHKVKKYYFIQMIDHFEKYGDHTEKYF